MSWEHYPESTQHRLRVEALNPMDLKDPETPHPYLQPGAFLIGNHADELSPWVPVLSTLCGASGYLSIPCCAWTFDARYERSKNTPFQTPMPLDEFVESLSLGGEGSNSSAYSSYRIWLASLSHYCGWKVETETLRIPSTRNWSLIGINLCIYVSDRWVYRSLGRSHTWQDEDEAQEVRANIENIISNVRDRGVFKTRTPEGKRADH